MFSASPVLSPPALSPLVFSLPALSAEDGTVYRPRSEYRALYDAQYARYRKLYPALREI